MISICMATYNGEKYIQNQLLSILNQIRQPDEVIICDDCSTDNTINIIKEFINTYQLGDNWRLFVNDKNLGYPFNFYNAISKSNGDIIFFADQDDIWEICKINKMELILKENPRILLLSCKHRIMNEEGKEINTYLGPSNHETRKVYKVEFLDILRRYEWPGMTMAIRKEFFNSINDNIDLYNIPHDFILAMLAADKQGFYLYDYIGVYHRRHENNLAREEHRISKLIKYKRKVYDISEYNEMLCKIIDMSPKLDDENINNIKRRLKLSEERLTILKNNKLLELIILYLKNRDILRFNSFVNDLLILLFSLKK